MPLFLQKKTMSSVRKKDQSEHRFTTLDKILDLYEHTTTVIANEKIFDRTYKSLIDRIDNEATMIYHLCRSANEDMDAREKEEAGKRIEMQLEAISYCKWLKTDIRLSQRKFHLRAKKVIYWNGLVNTAMDAINAWNKSEIRRYNETFGL